MMTPVTPIPDFITHYHLPDRRPFLNLSELDDESLAETIAELRIVGTAGRSERRFGPRYMSLRKRTEELLHHRFVQAGGRPQRRAPHYFVLGESAWFRGLYQDAAAVRLRLDDIPTEQISFTLPDSVAAMGLLPEYGIEVTPRPYHGTVFRIEELTDVAERYGLPGGARPASYQGYEFEDVEHFLEVQVWSDEPLEPYLHGPCGGVGS